MEHTTIFLWLFLFCTLATRSQVVTTSPEFPVPSEGVTVYFDATEGNQELMGCQGDIYAHTGVITQYSSSGTDWKYVIAGWNENLPKAKLTRLSTDYYELDITPSIIDYYSVPQGENILKLAFVFRNEDGSLVGREEDGSDIFVNVYYDPTGIIFNSPDTTNIFSLGDDIEINAVALFADEMQLFINDTLLETIQNNEMQYNYTASVNGFNKLKIIASGTKETVKDSTYFFVRAETQIADLPSNSLVDGINYLNDSTVTLILYAPYKEYAFVKGSWNDWHLSNSHQMYKTTNGNRYWITLDSLNPGQEYIYQYIVDGAITIADPYADKVLDPANDQYISEETYPNLIEYPSGKTSGLVSVFQTAQSPYQWEVEQFDRPDKQNLVIYELLIRDFIDAHNYTTLIDTLNYLASLGVNAIELMPVNEFEGNSSWGYNPSFYFAPDKYYGTKTDLKRFIDECHKRGIAVIMDIVLNHSYSQSPLVQLYFDPSAGDYGQPTAFNPWYNQESPNTAYSWGYDFDHESQQTKIFRSRVVKYWLQEYRFDGFRFDFTKGLTNTPGDGWAYDQARINILKDINDTIRSVESDAYVILEHFAENSEEKVLSNDGMMLWGNHNNNYCQCSMGYLGESNFSWISYKERGWQFPHLVGYMESHDEERQLYKNITWGNSYGSYDVTELSTALKRAELTAVLFFTIPGPKMIWQFEELGYDISIDYDCRVCEKPILWEYYTEEARYRLYRFFSEIIHLRKEYEAFRTGNFSIDATGLVKQIVLQHETMDVLVIGNIDVTLEEVEPNFSENTTWYEYFTGEKLTNIDTTMVLQPGEYRLYTTQQLTLPNIPAYPMAKDVFIKGEAFINEKLSGEYTFFDLNGDAEGTSIYKWYSADDSLGENMELIQEAAGKTYIPTHNDIGKYLFFEVIPVASSTNYKQGVAAMSLFKGPVKNNSNKVRVFPNPFKESFNIDNLEHYDKIEIFNYMGQVIEEIKTGSDYGYEVLLPGIRTGHYIIKLTGKKRVTTMKLVKL